MTVQAHPTQQLPPSLPKSTHDQDASAVERRDPGQGVDESGVSHLEACVATPVDPAAAAKAAGLRYSSDDKPGITRRRAGKGWSFTGPDGSKITDKETIARIKALAIPPAYRDVWINPNPRGHIQATGRDARGRKQYRYHPKWRLIRDESKYERMIAFGQALPTIREGVAADLKRPGLPREKVLATLVRLLETTLIRVGNEEYAKQNESYGLTTLHGDHVAVEGTRIEFSFRGKSGKDHHIGIRDRKLAAIMRKIQELPGQTLFQYADRDGDVRAVDSGDVNDYLRQLSGHDFTAKDFRTWGGTVLAALALRDLGPSDTAAATRATTIQAIDQVAARLGNTRAVCQKCYIHPGVLTGYADGSLLPALGVSELQTSIAPEFGLTQAEERVLAYLKEQQAIEASPSSKHRAKA